jgi:hypothetical protein
MRRLGLVLVAASLALEAGAVAIRPASAEEESAPITPAVKPAEPVQSTAPAAPAPEVTSEPATCSVAEAEPVGPISLPLSAFDGEGFVPLNTRGYNYPAQDDPPGRYVPDSTGTQPRPID